MKKTLKLSLLLIALSSCSYHVDKADPDDLGPITLVGFSQMSASVLGPKCSKCHEWTENYAVVRNLLTDMRARITSADPAFMMPRAGSPPLTRRERASLLAWIDAGGPQVPGQAPPPSTAVPGLNFGYVKEQVLDKKCFYCHRHSEDFDTYANTKPLLKETLNRLHPTDPDDLMPPQDKAQLTPDEEQLLVDWIQAGAPEQPGVPLPHHGPMPVPPPAPAPVPLPPPMPETAPTLVNFAYVKTHALQAKCLNCHHHASDFDTFAHMRPMLKDTLFRIHAPRTKDQMPPAKNKQLTSAELKLLDGWINAGAPET